MTPLAWKNLVHDPRRLAIAVSGVGFAVLLIFMQLGFLNALLESTVQLLRRLDGDLIAISSIRYTLPANERFDARRIGQIKEHSGIAAVYPVYIETVAGVLRKKDSRAYPIRVIAFHENDPVFEGEPLAVRAPELRRPASALIDVTSRGKYGLPEEAEKLAGYQAELSGRRIDLIGHFRLGVDFATDGNLLMTATNFASFFPNRVPGDDPRSEVDLAVIKVAAGSDVLQTKKTLTSALPDDVEILTRDELIQREMHFWRTNAPIGYIFLVGVYVGFIVGVVICYQLIYTDVTSHMREFATLKAMGYTDLYFVNVVLSQALYLSIMGFIPGAALSYLCYQALSAITGLTMELTPSLAVIVLLVTLLMCMVSGIMAMRKLLAMDPAELF